MRCSSQPLFCSEFLSFADQHRQFFIFPVRATSRHVSQQNKHNRNLSVCVCVLLLLLFLLFRVNLFIMNTTTRTTRVNPPPPHLLRFSYSYAQTGYTRFTKIRSNENGDGDSICATANKAFNRQGTQHQRPESPTVTPPGIRENTGYINSTKRTSSMRSSNQPFFYLALFICRLSRWILYFPCQG